MKFLYENFCETTLITVSSELTGFEFIDAMNDSRLSRVGRTAGILDEFVSFNLGTPKAITDICIKGHNFTASAIVTLQGNSSTDFTTPDYELVLTVAETIWDSLTETYQYWRISIQDTNNTSAFLQIAYIFLGAGLTFASGAQGQTVSMKSTSRSTKSIGMQQYGDVGIKYLSEKINFPDDMTQTEINYLKTFIDYVDTISPFTLILWEDYVVNYPPLYCNFTKLPEFVRSGQGLIWNGNFEVEECK